MFVVGLAGLAAASPVDAQLSKCTDAAGKVTYQQKPCEAGSAQKKITVEGSRKNITIDAAQLRPPNERVAGPPSPEEDASRKAWLAREVEEAPRRKAWKAEQTVGATLMFKMMCDLYFPGFATRAASEFDKFRRQHEVIVRKIESARDYPTTREEVKRLGALQNSDPVKAAQFRQNCDNGLVALAEANAPGDPRMQSPEVAWRGFLSAVREGNHTAAVQFLTGRALKSLGEALPKMSADAMRAMADSFVGFQVSHQFDDIAEVFVSRKTANGNRVGSMEFVKVGPNWKIGGL